MRGEEGRGGLGVKSGGEERGEGKRRGSEEEGRGGLEGGMGVRTRGEVLKRRGEGRGEEDWGEKREQEGGWGGWAYCSEGRRGG